MMVRFIAILLTLVSFSVVSAQTLDPERLDELARQSELEKNREAELGKSKEAVQRDIQSLRGDLVQVATEAEDYERKARDIEQKLAKLKIRKSDVKAGIYEDRKTLMRLLGALQRVEANPPPALAVSPEDAADAVRAAKIMSGMSANLKLRADALIRELETLADVQANIEIQREELKANEALLETKRVRIKSLVSQKARLAKSISIDQAEAQQRVAALAAEANSLRELISKFEQSTRGVVPRLKPDIKSAARPDNRPSNTTPNRPRPSAPLTLPPNTLKFAEARGRIKAPVGGRVTKTYTRARKGLTVSTRPRAQVVAPHAGRVEFAGPFKNYENVVILNMGEGYFMLLTGLGEVYAKANEMVSPGEPLGLMPFNTQEAKELYIEIRKDGAAINPAPWLGTAFAG